MHEPTDLERALAEYLEAFGNLPPVSMLPGDEKAAAELLRKAVAEGSEDVIWDLLPPDALT